MALGVVTLWSQLATLAFPPAAFVILWLSGETDPLLATASQIGLVLLAVVAGIVALGLHSETFACRAGDNAASAASAFLRILRRGPVAWSGEQLARFRADAVQLLRARWHWLTLGTLVGHLSVYLVLIVTLRAVGVGTNDVSLAESFAAWSLVRLLGSIPIAPGGLGVVEVGLTTALVGFGGEEAAVVAAVVVYRFLTLVVPLVCGALAGIMWRRQHPAEAALARPSSS